MVLYKIRKGLYIMNYKGYEYNSIEEFDRIVEECDRKKHKQEVRADYLSVISDCPVLAIVAFIVGAILAHIL